MPMIMVLVKNRLAQKLTLAHQKRYFVFSSVQFITIARGGGKGTRGKSSKIFCLTCFIQKNFTLRSYLNALSKTFSASQEFNFS